MRTPGSAEQLFHIGNPQLRLAGQALLQTPPGVGCDLIGLVDLKL